MKAKATIVSLFALALTLLATPAVAAPPGGGLETIPVTCDGQEVTVTVSGGASFWIEDQHYVLTSFTGTFTPAEGEPETFTKTYGQKTGLAGSEITCTATFEEAEGTFEIRVSAVAVP
jgi:hypothetical protein